MTGMLCDSLQEFYNHRVDFRDLMAQHQFLGRQQCGTVVRADANHALKQCVKHTCAILCLCLSLIPSHSLTLQATYALKAAMHVSIGVSHTLVQVPTEPASDSDDEEEEQEEKESGPRLRQSSMCCQCMHVQLAC
jgi:hypothetical protein